MRWGKIFGIAALTVAGLLAWSSTYVWMGCKPESGFAAQAFRFAVPEMPPLMRAAAEATPGYKRQAGSGTLAYMAHIPDLAEEDFARFLNRNPGGAFPYFGEVRSFWASYCGVNRNLAEGFLPHWPAHVRIYLVGFAHSAEFGLRGLVHLATGRHLGPTGLFGIAAGAVDTRNDAASPGDQVHAIVDGRPKDEPYARMISREGSVELVALPSGRGLQTALRSLAATPTRVLDMAGNDMVLLTALVPAGWDGTRPAPGLFANDVPGGRLVRMGMMVPASQILANIRVIEASGGAIEAVYP